MKKMLLLVTVLMATVVAQAQVLRAAPRSQAFQPSVPSVFKSTIAPKEGQMWWGYFSESDFDILDTTIGVGSPTSFMAAIYVPANHEQIGGSTVKAARIYIEQGLASTFSNVKIWISKKLPATPDDADYVQSIDEKLTTGANDFELDKPYEIENEAFYVGYYFKSSNSYPIRCGGIDTPNAFLLSVPGSIDWDDLYGYGFGKLAFQILVEGANVNNDCATIADFKPAVAGPGQVLNIPVTLTNEGANDITEISYTVSANGSTSEENTIAIQTLPFNGTRQVTVPVNTLNEEGQFTYTITITKVNGNPNNSNHPSATGNITTIVGLKTFPRNVLIEEFTTESCGYCPDAAAGLSSFMTSYPELAKRVAIVCHHAGYGTDWLTVNASTSYTWFYNEGGSTYAPAFMYDRYAWDGRTPVVSREGGASGYKSRVEDRIAENSYANIDLKASFSGNSIVVTAECERGWDFSSTPARITLFLTEDNIKAKSQSGASNFVHQHVLRAVNETWGAELKWDDNKATYSYTFNLNSSWKTEDLKVIAFISGYDKNDPTNCVVENAAVTVPEGEIQAFYNLIALTSEGGTLSVDGEQVTFDSPVMIEVKTGSSVTIKVIPDEGYVLEMLTANDNDVTDQVEDNKYTIKNFSEDMTVSATFIIDEAVDISDVEYLNGKMDKRGYVYDLQGRRVRASVNEKGLYIKGGKKVIVK